MRISSQNICSFIFSHNLVERRQRNRGKEKFMKYTRSSAYQSESEDACNLWIMGCETIHIIIKLCGFVYAHIGKRAHTRKTIVIKMLDNETGQRPFHAKTSFECIFRRHFTRSTKTDLSKLINHFHTYRVWHDVPTRSCAFARRRLLAPQNQSGKRISMKTNGIVRTGRVFVNLRNEKRLLSAINGQLEQEQLCHVCTGSLLVAISTILRSDSLLWLSRRTVEYIACSPQNLISFYSSKSSAVGSELIWMQILVWLNQ